MHATFLHAHYRTAFALALASVGSPHASVQSPAPAADVEPATVVTVDPRVPRAAGTPCVVQLIDHQPFSGEGEYQTDNHFTYMPPQAATSKSAAS